MDTRPVPQADRRQTGDRVGFFLRTDDFARDHARMTAAGFLEEPRHEPYGTVAVFRDAACDERSALIRDAVLPGYAAALRNSPRA